MAAHENFFLPINEALALNGQFGRGYPYYMDVNQLNLLWVMPVTYTDPNDIAGSPKNGFEFAFYDNKRIRYDTMLFGNSTYSTVTLWLNYLNSIGFSPMTQYNNYIKINRRAIGTARNILVNDEKLVRRVYRASNNETDLYLDSGNTITRTILTVQGDQTIAGGYYYEA